MLAPTEENKESKHMTSEKNSYQLFVQKLQQLCSVPERKFIKLCPTEWGFSFESFHRHDDIMKRLLGTVSSVGSGSQKNKQRKKDEIVSILNSHAEFAGLKKYYEDNVETTFTGTLKQPARPEPERNPPPTQIDSATRRGNKGMNLKSLKEENKENIHILESQYHVFQGRITDLSEGDIQAIKFFLKGKKWLMTSRKISSVFIHFHCPGFNKFLLAAPEIIKNNPPARGSLWIAEISVKRTSEGTYSLGINSATPVNPYEPTPPGMDATGINSATPVNPYEPTPPGMDATGINSATPVNPYEPVPSETVQSGNVKIIPKRNPAKAKIPLQKINPISAQKASESAQRSMVDITDFSRNASTIRIYIDEAWPDSERGVIGGIVWCGDKIDEKKLPHIKTHNRGEYSFPLHIQQLLACKEALPFIFPIAYPSVTQTKYPEMIRIALTVLLGWILPQEGKKCNVQVFLEGISVAKLPVEKNVAPLFQEMRNSIALTTGRMQRWNITEVYSMSPENKSFEYIPYADMICYFTFSEKQEKAEQFESQFQVRRTWSGYVPLSVDLLRMLIDLDTGSAAGYAETLLNFAKGHSGTKLYAYVIKHAVERAKKDPELLRAIFEQLEKMYEAKDRDLKQLDAVVIPFVKNFALEELEKYPKQKLIRILVELQHANHNGNPIKAQQCVELYEKEREKLLKQGQDLCAYADMNLAVHYNDRLEFEKALAICSRWESNPAFDFLTLENQGRILSSIGQNYAFRKDYQKADEYFIKAIQIFRNEDNPLTEQIDQTMVYRAMNLLDFQQYSLAAACAEQVFGCSFEEAIEKYAATLSKPFHHHLLLKNLFFNPEVKHLRSVYLQTRPNWLTLKQHPWELIQLYRCLLLAKTDPVASEQCFSLLWNFYELESGAIMHVLEVFARAAHDLEFQTDENKDIIKVLCDSTQKSLPASVPYCQRLLSAIKQEELFDILPFNYK